MFHALLALNRLSLEVKRLPADLQTAVDNMNDIVIVDTAGRLQIDEEMMQEAVAIKQAVKPDQILMVVAEVAVSRDYAIALQPG